MDLIAHYLQQGFLFIVPMIILLGLLIFVHELGHFLVAKYYGVKVEVFSLGFGKKLLQYKRGDTNYVLALIPLGGYVKMFGDDPSVELPPEQQGVAFLYKPVGQKMAIVLAGPLMNLFFAILLFGAVAMVGEPAMSPTTGDILTGTEAYSAGFRSGDKIAKVNDQAVRTWEDIKRKVQGSAGEKLSFEVLRSAPTASATKTVQIAASPKKAANQDIFSTEAFVGDIEGLVNTSRATVLGVIDPTSPAHIAGLRTGDFVTSLNDVDVSRWRDFLRVIEELRDSKELKFKITRPLRANKTTEDLLITLDPSGLSRQDSAEQTLKAMGIEYPALILSEVVEDSPADAAGLRPGDKILSINGQAMASWDQVLSTITAYQRDSGALSITVQRGSAEMSFEVTPRLTKIMNPQGAEVERFAVGIGSAYLVNFPETFELRTLNPIQALMRGAALSWQWTKVILVGLVRLIQAKVSSKNISGVITIGREASNAFQRGLSSFLSIMAIISINLFILNLLPIPILDGGHIVFFSIEALRGAPLSMRKMEIAQQVGLVLLIGLMAFALFNDVTRLLN